MNTSNPSSTEPWLTIFGDGERTVNFYTTAFDAIETYRLQDPSGGLVVRLSVNGAGFWISCEENQEVHLNNMMGGNAIRMILIVEDPDALFAQAIQAGASEIFPVSEDYGWRLGRLSDPYGFQWEIGHQLAQQ